jgi:hypothetical protein
VTEWTVGTMAGGFGAWKGRRLCAGPFKRADDADRYVGGVLRNARRSAFIRETVSADESTRWSIQESSASPT